MGGLELGLLGLIGLVLTFWAIFHVVQSHISPLGKAIWVVLLLVIPFLAFIAWLLFGPRAGR